VVGAIAAMVACAEPTSNPSGVRTSTFAPSQNVFLPPGGTLNVVEAERIEVCKVYVMTSGAQPPATTNFLVNGPGTVDGAFSLTPGQCREVWVGSNETVTIQEETLAGFTQACARTLLDASTPACNSGTLATSFVSGTVGAQAGERVVSPTPRSLYPMAAPTPRATGRPLIWTGRPGGRWLHLLAARMRRSSARATWIEMFNTPVKGNSTQLAHQHGRQAERRERSGRPDAAAPRRCSMPRRTSAVRVSHGRTLDLRAVQRGITGPGHCEDEISS
jgi:hypothetical protein